MSLRLYHDGDKWSLKAASWLVEQISGDKPQVVNPVLVPGFSYFVVSGRASEDMNAVWWGTGLSSFSSPRDKPRSVCAIRGQLTQTIMLSAGFPCIDAMVDPLILASKFMSVSHRKTRRERCFLLSCSPSIFSGGDIILRPDASFEETLLLLAESEVVITDNVVGLALAHSYGRLACLVYSEDKPDPTNLFMLYDYCSAFGLYPGYPKKLCSSTEPLSDSDLLCIPKSTILEKQGLALDTCPFISSGRKIWDV